MDTGPIIGLERGEVLKVPQGTLYGRNTTAGLINFITAKPTDHFAAGISAELGNYQTYNFAGHISAPLGAEVAARPANRSAERHKGWQFRQSRPDARLGQGEEQGRQGHHGTTTSDAETKGSRREM